MTLYFDASALVKLVVSEPESDALQRFLDDRAGVARVTSALARVEVVQAVIGGGSGAAADARDVLGQVDQVSLDDELLDRAAALAFSTMLRSLDAIHLAAAQTLGADLSAVVTYDRRVAAAAAGLGMTVEMPGAAA